MVEDPGYEFAAADDEEEHIGNLAALLATKEDGILIATDGGAMQLGEHYRWRCASWAVVVDGQAFSGLVRGEERTAAAGERTAFSVLCRAAVLAQRQVKVLVDNLAIVQGCHRRQRYDREEVESSCGPFGMTSSRLRTSWM